MSENPNSSKFPISVKLALVLACLAVVLTVGGVRLSVWAAGGCRRRVSLSARDLVIRSPAAGHYIVFWRAGCSRQLAQPSALRLVHLPNRRLYQAMAIYVLSGIKHL